ncbi:MAG: transposase [Roseburia inulinivorans]
MRTIPDYRCGRKKPHDLAEILYEHDIHIIIDGKALRGAATQMVIAQFPINEKTNEITAIPKLLDIDGNTFIIDAVGTQKKTEYMIAASGWHFILQVKRNNPALYDEICDAFATFESELKCPENERSERLKKYPEQYDRWQDCEKDRGRVVYWDMQTCTDASFLDCVNDGTVDYIKTIGCMEQVRVPVEKDAEGNDIAVGKKEYLEKGTVRNPRPEKSDAMEAGYQQVGMISDLALSAEEMAKYKREHWRIENNLHHVLDDAFREDRSTAKGSKNNLS